MLDHLLREQRRHFPQSLGESLWVDALPVGQHHVVVAVCEDPGEYTNRDRVRVARGC